MKSKLALFLAVAILTTLVALPATASAAITLTPTEKKIVSLVNKARTERGLHKLYVKPCLVRAARAHSAEMGGEQYFDHDSFSGDSFARRLIKFGYKRAGYSFWKVGEDIAWGSGLYSAPEVIFDGWMHSKPHRAVILTKRFRNIGVGVKVCDEGYGGCTDPVTFFTLDLGRRID
ncbi:MAG TPA: CAP domain-containing protein [Thermoleophilia bacterium]|nr:CAP domain-containing protein [Thermoleophilia bacterium]HQG55051.1 CAP domain-containing protein [Thermoleophilia bacterium]HQJ97994.1 CAP domain-containing protein [Thermoleophilia bacterium]